MKPAEGNLERLVKKASKGQDVAPADLLFHWNGLGRQGDRLVINLLNRQRGWEAMARLAQSQPEVKAKLATIADLAGVTEDAAQLLREAGIAVDAGDSARGRAQWVLQAVRESRTIDWDRARNMLLRDPDLLAGVVPLLETIDPAEAAARFCATVLESKPPREQEQPLRKALYHLKQRGVEVGQRATGVLQYEREMFALGENRVPLWQPVLYFRAHSAFTDSGDLYILRIMEGTQFDASEHKRDLHMGRPEFLQVAENFTQHLQRDMGVSIPFHYVGADIGRYFLQQSAHLQKETLAVDEFFKFLGQGPAVDPLAGLRSAEPPPLSIASNVLNDPYFFHWILQTEDVHEYLAAVEQLQQGAIILPESQVKERSRHAEADALRRLFTEPVRALWSFAFEKAAYFLAKHDPQKAQFALALSRGLADSHIAVDDLYVATWLFEKTVQFEMELKKKKQEEEKRGSLIMSPQEFTTKSQRPPRS